MKQKNQLTDNKSLDITIDGLFYRIAYVLYCDKDHLDTGKSFILDKIK